MWSDRIHLADGIGHLAGGKPLSTGRWAQKVDLKRLAGQRTTVRGMGLAGDSGFATPTPGVPIYEGGGL